MNLLCGSVSQAYSAPARPSHGGQKHVLMKREGGRYGKRDRVTVCILKRPGVWTCMGTHPSIRQDGEALEEGGSAIYL